MSVDYTLMIKRIQKLEQVYVLFAESTRLPFIECDQEDFDDQVYIYADEDAAKEAVKDYEKKQMPLKAVKLERKQMPVFFTSIHLLGANMLVFYDKVSISRIPLSQVIKIAPKKNEDSKIPAENSSLQLTIIYFIQELRRPGQKKDDMERMKRLQELEEEMTVDLIRSRFILPVNASQDNGEVKIPYIKTPTGDIFQPIFSDVWELQKFHRNPEVKLKMAVVPFEKLLPSLVEQAKGYVLNPGGVNLILTREQLTAISKRFGEA